MTGKHRGFLALGSALLLMPACDAGGGGGWAGSIDTLASGTVVVRNPAEELWSPEEAWTVREEVRIGSIEGGSPAGFAQVVGVAPLPDGGVAVLDRQYHELRAFDASGAHLWSTGREGGGPGEFVDPIGVVASPDGELWVADPNARRYSVHDADGTYLRSHPRQVGGYSLPWRADFTPDGRLREVAYGGGRSILITLDSTGMPVDTMAFPERPPSESFTLTTETTSMSAGVPFAPSQVQVWDPRGYIWVGDSGRYRIVQLSEAGDTLRIIERPGLPRLPVTEAEREEALENLAWFIRQGGKVDASRIPSEKPYFMRFFPDPEGRLWVLRTAAEGEPTTTYDVFDPEGRFLGQVTPFTSFGSAPQFRGDVIWGTDADSLGVTYVVRGRVVRP